GTADAWASPHGFVPAAYREYRRWASASRSRFYALRLCRASSSGDAFWPRHRRGNFVLEVPSFLAARLSRSRARRYRARAHGCSIGHSATLMYVLNFSAWTHIHCGNYAAATALIDEFAALKDQTGSLFWAAWGMMQGGCVLALTDKVSDAVQ